MNFLNIFSIQYHSFQNYYRPVLTVYFEKYELTRVYFGDQNFSNKTEAILSQSRNVGQPSKSTWIAQNNSFIS